MSTDVDTRVAFSNILIPQAASIAAFHHKEQKRKGSSTPYINHPMRVAHLVALAGLPAEAIAAAYLHDVVEDCGVKVEELVRQGIPDRTVEIVGKLSKWWPDDAPANVKDEGKKTYYAGIINDPEVLTIKLLDRVDNLREMLDDLDKPYGNLRWSRNYARKTRKEFMETAHEGRSLFYACENAYAKRLLVESLERLIAAVKEQGLEV